MMALGEVQNRFENIMYEYVFFFRTESPVLNKNSDKGAVKKKSKALLELEEFLPPLPDLTQLNINAQEEFMHIGKISAVIAELGIDTYITRTRQSY